MVARRGVSALRRWAAANIIVADGPRAGKRWKPGNPAWGEVLDAMDDRTLEQVTVRGSVQSGKTASLLVAALGHSAAGRSVLFYEPDEALRRSMSTRIRAWARASRDPVLREAWERPRPPHSRSYANGGRLEVLSAGQRTGTLMRTAEIVILDELRAFNRDIVLELVDRMAAYGGKGRLITASSAGEEDSCRTTTELEKSDARHWFVPCPACSQSAPLAWSNVVLPRSTSARPVYVTPCCRAETGTVALRRAVAGGEWRATRRAAVSATRGYHADCFASPFETLATITRAWARANHHRKQTSSMAEIRAFQQGRLALPFKPEPAGGVTPEQIATTCREDYAVIPAEACVLIGAVDVQDNRLEAEVSAWGLAEVERHEAEVSGIRGWDEPGYHGLSHGGRWYRLRRWALEYRKIPGDPGTAAPWDELVAMMETARPHASGCALRPVMVGIDSGGHYTEQVADFVKANGAGYQALKGLPPTRFGGVLMRRSITQDALHDYGSNGLGLVCTNAGKATVFSLLRQSCQGVEPRPMTWPADEAFYGPEQFEGICSETLERVIDKRTGRTRLQWRKIGRANEPLDLLVYSLAAVSYLGIAFMLGEAQLIEEAGHGHHQSLAA